ncbi:MAG: NADH:ubiquinone reductase (Na(+)-transporting) subunit C [Lepagella sp.]
MKINKNSNVYTVIYILALVLVVGVGLSLVYQALSPTQEENMANDKKRQILAAALIFPTQGESVADLYRQHIVATRVVNSRGMDATGAPDAFAVNMPEQAKLPADRRLLPVFVCRVGEQMKYIVPVYGAGLWGPIWGYIAMNADGQSIYGAYFAHQGETPGLGAEIEKPAFSDQFKGKTLYDEGSFEPVKVVKNGHEPEKGSYVHAISGGTITSQGVQKMLDNSMRPYDAFFRNLQNQDKK